MKSDDIERLIIINSKCNNIQYLIIVVEITST